MSKEDLKSYVKAVIHSSLKYPLSELSEGELVDMLYLVPAPSVDFSEWDQRRAGVPQEAYITEEEMLAANRKAVEQERELRKQANAKEGE